MPLKNTAVIHPRFQQHHRPVSEGAMVDAKCRIYRPSSQANAFDDAAGKSIYPTPVLVYEGICRVHRLGGSAPGAEASAVTVADRQVALGAIQVVIPCDSDLVQVHDIVEITECKGDPDLVGQKADVQGARRSALSWERVIGAQMQQRTTR